jgi:hypothetical protein
VWLPASYPCNLTVQLKDEKLLVVQPTADGFRATVSALWFLAGKEDVSFHTFYPSEDRCVLLLVKNLGKWVPERVVLEQLKALNIRAQGVPLLRSSCCDQDHVKDLPHPHFISIARGPELSRVRSELISAACGSH